jgi:flap endonuclease-1
LGVKLGSLVEARRVTVADLAGRRIAIDGHNILYQFLSSIRSRQGDPLRDRKGRVTSHLSGLVYRNSRLIEAGIKLVYVFDGRPHSFKAQVIRERRQTRRKAQIKYDSAVKEGRVEDARRFAQATAKVNVDIIGDAKRLLTLMGVPWVQAPEEGEAQSAFMATKGDVWASGSQDFDSLLFGAPVLVRNLNITGRRKLPQKNVYVKVEPEIIELGKFLRELKLTREQLIDIGILVGTDYNPKGIKGIGPKTALKLIKKHGSIENAIPFMKNPEFPHPLDEIRELFADPATEKDYSLVWRPSDHDGIIGFLCGERDFDRSRLAKALERMDKGFSREMERTTLDQWFRAPV